MTQSTKSKAKRFTVSIKLDDSTPTKFRIPFRYYACLIDFARVMSEHGDDAT